MTNKKYDEGEIYLITNKQNGKQYIGQTTSYFPSGRKNGGIGRWRYHVYRALNNKNECTALANAIRKYGKDEFTLTILLSCNKIMLDEYERKFIELFNTLSPNGYNIEKGGSVGKVIHEGSRKKISDKHRFLKTSEENKNRILLSMKELGIDKLPMNIQYSNDKKSGYEGFSYLGRCFRAKGRTLTEKLDQALTYAKLLQTNDVELLEEFDKKIVTDTSILIKSAKVKSIDSNAREAMKACGVDTLPLYVRYEKRNSRFYVKIKDEACHYFTKYDPKKSLCEAIIYINSRNGNPSEELSAPMKA